MLERDISTNLRTGTYAPRRALAAVVTYNPDASLGVNLSALRGPDSDSDTLIVDNGSTNVAWVEEVAAANGCVLIRNTSNLGIAKALNQAAHYALDNGYAWLATFDQDSLAASGLIGGLIASFSGQLPDSRVAVICASHVDRQTGLHYYAPQHVLSETAEWRVLRSTITSGSLIPTSVFEEVGFFDESLFIDFVDHDFYLRCRKFGMNILESRSQVLSHSIGHSTVHKLLGRTVVCSNHSPLRRYYMTRNQLEIYRRYFAFDFDWCARGLFHLIVGSVLVLIFEDQKFAKLRSMAGGTRDFVLRRFGPKAADK